MSSVLADRLARLSAADRAAIAQQLAVHDQTSSEHHLARRITPIDEAPLTAAQKRLWFLDRLEPGHPAYNSPLPIRLTGPLDTTRLHNALNALLARHAILRTSFHDHGDQPFQRIHHDITLDLPLADLRNLHEDQQPAVLGDLVKRHARHQFNLETAPLMAARLVRLGDKDHALLLNFHHIVTDGWSVSVILNDLDALYRGEDIAPLPIQFADLAYTEAEAVADQLNADTLEWWHAHLDNAHATEVPTDFPRPAKQDLSGDAIELTIPAVQGRLIQALGRRTGASPFAILMAVFYTLLNRYTDDTDLTVGSVSANRNRRETESLIGFFVNTLVLRQKLDLNQSFESFTAAVNQTILTALDRSSIHFDQLVEKLNPARDASRNPLVQVALAVQNSFKSESRVGPCEAHLMSANYQATRFDIELHWFPELDGSWRGALLYASALYQRDSMQAFADRFTHLLKEVVTRPNTPLSKLSLINSAEAIELSSWSHGSDPQPYRSLSARLRAQSEMTPGAIAFTHHGVTMSYRELHQRVEALAGYLQNQTVERARIGAAIPISPFLVITALACFQSGRAFVPLDTAQPLARLIKILEDASPALVLADQETDLTRAAEQHGCIVQLGEPHADDALTIIDPTPETIAYVIYTSGTTGVPKGVLVPHRGISNLVDAFTDDLNITADARILQFSAPSFDAFIFELAMAFGSGGCLLLPDSDSDLDRLAIAARATRDRATHVTLPPSLLVEIDPMAMPTLRTVVVAGEAATPAIFHWADHVRLFNAYGPTEATIWSTLQRLDGTIQNAPPIGRPIRGHHIYIANSHQQIQPKFIRGEIIIGGIGLADGYLNRPSETAERFITLNGPEGPTRIYRSGDRGFFDADGRLHFVDRADRQLKIRGYRIEPGDIEQCLMKHPAIAEAFVIGRAQRLDAFIVLKPNRTIAIDALQSYLAELLPYYMCPRTITAVAKFPRNRSGKIDSAALPTSDLGHLGTKRLSAREADIAAIFSEILKISVTSPDANFFEMGGHSILLLKLQRELEHSLGLTIPLAHLFASPTVKSIASYAQAHSNEPLPDHVIAFRTTGSLPPLFFIHPAIGTSLGYGQLASKLSHERPVYGFEAPDTVRNLDDLATHYAESIIKICGDRSCDIGGWSLGGAIAYAVALRLRKMNRDVRLVMMDAGLPWTAGNPNTKSWLIVVYGVIRELVKAVPRSRAEWDDLAALAGIRRTNRWVSGIATIHETWRRRQLTLALSQAWLSWTPAALDCPTLIIRATQDGICDKQDPLVRSFLQWLKGSVVIRGIQASHMTLLGSPQAVQLATLLEEFLDTTGDEA